MDDRTDRELPNACVIVASAFFALALAKGIRSSIGFLVHPWEDELGWDRAREVTRSSFWAGRSSAPSQQR